MQEDVFLEQFPLPIELQDLQVETETAFTWEIDSYRNLAARALSNSFTAGGHTWKLLLFPAGVPGKARRGTLSVFLQLVSLNAPEAPKAVCVRFNLIMWNPNHPEALHESSANHRYTSEGEDWGFTEFQSICEAVVKSTRTAPLIDHEKTNFTVIVRTLKDPTGQLWYDFNDYNSKKETGFVGLANQGATCYLNSLLQSLYFTRVFRDAVYRIPPDTDPNSVTNGLQRLFYLLDSSQDMVETMALTRSFGWHTADAFTQHDVQELNRILMDRLESKMKGTKVDGFLSRIFVGQTKSFIKCLNVDFESARVEDFWDVQLNVKGLKNVYESFEQYVEPELLQGENQYYAEGYGLQDARKGVIFESFPPVLHLQLKRYDYDYERDVELKINDRYEFPAELDLTKYVDPASPANADGEPWIYELHGVLVHSGDLNIGHYYALIRPDRENAWYCFDDERVTKATQREVLEDNLGGEYPNGNRGIKRITSAYMLVYIRRSRYDFVLPQTSQAVPESIQERVRAEQKAEDDERAEQNRQRQQMSLLCLSNNELSNHIGLGLTSTDSHGEAHDEPRKLTVPRKLKIGELRGSLQSKGGLPHPPSLWFVDPGDFRILRIDDRFDDHCISALRDILWHSPSLPCLWIEDKAGDIKSQTLVFVKIFDAAKQTLNAPCSAWLSNAVPLSDGLAHYGKYEIYQEHRDEVALLDKSFSATDLEIVSGNILIIEVTTTAQVEFPTLSMYYSFLQKSYSLIPVPRVRSETQESYPSLTASMADTYETLAQRLGEFLHCHPQLLLLWGPYMRHEYRKSICANGSNLKDLYENRATGYRQLSIEYDILKNPLAADEFRLLVPVVWIFDSFAVTREIECVLSSSRATVSDLIRVATEYLGRDDQQMIVNDPTRLEVWTRYGFFDIQHAKLSTSVLNYEAEKPFYIRFLTPNQVQLLNCGSPDVAHITVLHLRSDFRTVCGIPFRYALANNATLKTVRSELQVTLGLAPKVFDRLKLFVIIGNSQKRLLEDQSEDSQEILFDSIKGTDAQLAFIHLEAYRPSQPNNALQIN